MSKSKRAVRAAEAPAPQAGNGFRRADGRVRAGWLLAASLLGYALAALALRRGLAALLSALTEAWGVNASTALRAPAWARTLWSWKGSLVTAVVSAALLCLSLGLRRLWGLDGASMRFRGRRLLLATLAGLALAILVLLLGLIPDSLRMEPDAPRLRASLPALCAVSLLAAISEEAFTKGVLFDGLADRWGRPWATVAACAVFFLSNGGMAGNAVSAVNVLLLGLVCCAAHARYGLWSAVGLRWGWSVATVFLMGFGGGEASLMRFYGVSEALLTGGDAGPVYGLYATAALALALAWLERDALRRAVRR